MKMLNVLILGLLSTVSVAQVQNPTAHADRISVLDAESDTYVPLDDVDALFGQRLYDAVDVALFGTALGSDVVNLDLAGPIGDDSYASGQNRMGLPFNVWFADLTLTNLEDGTTVGVWSGVLSGMSDIWVYGLYIENGNTATILPIYSRVDQSQIASVISYKAATYGSRRWECELDPIAVHQAVINQAEIINCISNHKAAIRTHLGICAATLPACWITAGLSCLGTLGCLISVPVIEYHWDTSYQNQLQMNTSCLCTDSNMRTAFPDINTPTSRCSKFECPPHFPFNILPKFGG